MEFKLIDIRKLCFSIVPLIYSIVVSAQTDTIKLKLKDSTVVLSKIFSSNEPLNIVLKFNIKKYQKERKFEKYHPAKLYMEINDSSLLQKKVRLKSRGIFRKNHCSMPPFWLNARRVKNKEAGININDKYKVVTHCNYSSAYEEYILKEYLVYRIFNLLTENSFKVRLVNFTYIDTGRKNKSYKRWGFIIEPIELLASRLNCFPIKLNSLGVNYTDTTSTDLVCMYAYMIGNTDWSFTGRHNIKLIKSVSIDKPAVIPIPYDFDYTGFVNTHYALPAEGLGLNKVRERIYGGPCRELLNYQIAAQKLINHKDEIYTLLEDFEHLKKSTRQDILKFLDEYYRNIIRPDFIKYHIDIDCYEYSEE